MQNQTPVLYYDGNCAFCRHWVNYWKTLTERRVVYTSVTTQRLPTVRLVDSDGREYQAAAAVFRLLTYGGRPRLWWSYRFLPGFALFSELLYRYISHRRSFFHTFTHWFWKG